MQHSDQNINGTEISIRGVALDMDGLLFDTERLYYRVGQTMLNQRGHDFTPELQRRMMGRVGLTCFEEMIRFCGLSDSAETLMAESESLYLPMLSAELTSMPGLADFMDTLLETGLPFGLATSSQLKFVEVILETVGWRDRLAFVLTGNDVTHGKPHPEIYQRAAACMNVSPGEMLVLEDSGNGAAAAVAAGAVTVAIPNDHTRDHGFDGVHMIASSLTDPALMAVLTAGR